MKKLKLVGILLTVVLLVVSLAGCGEGNDDADELVNTAEVVRGNLVVDITAAGNLILSQIEDLAFEISGTDAEPLTVSEVLVEEGDGVTAGQVLVTLDISAIEDKITTREEALETAELNLNSAKIDYETSVRNAEDSLRSAEQTRDNARDSYQRLVYPYTASTFTLDAPQASSEMQVALQALNQALAGLDQALPSAEMVNIGEDHNSEALKINTEVYDEILFNLKLAIDNVTQAKLDLDPGSGTGMLTDNMLSVSQYWNVKSALQTLDNAQLALEKAHVTANNTIAKAQVAYDKVVAAYDQAQTNLEEARAELDKVEITAPFDGFVTQINVEGGDEVKKGTVAVQIADPNRFEAEILVSEMDIAQIDEGSSAQVAVDSLSGVTLPASVTHISPRATIQSGVVNYAVTVEISSTDSLTANRTAAREELQSQISSGEIPERLQQAIDSGQMTQEQVEALMQRIQEGGLSGGFGQGTGQGTGQTTGQLPAAAPVSMENIQLRQGLSVTITLIVDQATDALLIPNGAISSRGGQSSVQVMNTDGETETRQITTGISNWSDTVVTDGLSEGELVVVPQGTTSSVSSTTQQGPPSGGLGSFGRMIR